MINLFRIALLRLFFHILTCQKSTRLDLTNVKTFSDRPKVKKNKPWNRFWNLTMSSTYMEWIGAENYILNGRANVSDHIYIQVHVQLKVCKQLSPAVHSFKSLNHFKVKQISQ